VVDPERQSFTFHSFMALLASFAIQGLTQLAIFHKSVQTRLKRSKSPMDAISPPSYRELLLTTFLDRGSVGNVFRGRFDHLCTDNVIGKVAVDTQSQARLHHEAKIYAALTALQGTVIPTFYGLYVGRGLQVLLMRDAGKSLSSFSTLSRAQQYVIHILREPFHLRYVPRLDLWVAILSLHQAGVSHLDLRPDNVVLSQTGVVQVLDFSHAALHGCPGVSECPELQDMRQTLQIL
jgi:serine/threonine protein kinase